MTRVIETNQQPASTTMAFMFGFTKVVKLVGLFRTNPSHIMSLPVSILFGYFHGLIKLYALFTLNEVNYERPFLQTRPT
jgi:hypothetical protein